MPNHSKKTTPLKPKKKSTQDKSTSVSSVRVAKRKSTSSSAPESRRIISKRKETPKANISDSERNAVSILAGLSSSSASLSSSSSSSDSSLREPVRVAAVTDQQHTTVNVGRSSAAASDEISRVSNVFGSVVYVKQVQPLEYFMRLPNFQHHSEGRRFKFLKAYIDGQVSSLYLGVDLIIFLKESGVQVEDPHKLGLAMQDPINRVVWVPKLLNPLHQEQQMLTSIREFSRQLVPVAQSGVPLLRPIPVRPPSPALQILLNQGSVPLLPLVSDYSPSSSTQVPRHQVAVPLQASVSAVTQQTPGAGLFQGSQSSTSTSDVVPQNLETNQVSGV